MLMDPAEPYRFSSETGDVSRSGTLLEYPQYHPTCAEESTAVSTPTGMVTCRGGSSSFFVAAEVVDTPDFESKGAAEAAARSGFEW